MVTPLGPWTKFKYAAFGRRAYFFRSDLSFLTLVNVNAPVVATTSWWLHFSAQVVAEKVKKSIPVDFMIY